MANGGFIITRQGLNCAARALAGQELQFTRVAFGDCESNGTVVTVDDDSAVALTNLINWKQDLPIVASPTVTDGQVSIPFLVSNANVTAGYWMRETGVFAKIPGSDEEILYAYSYDGDKGGWMFPTGGSQVWEQTYTAILAVGNANNITAVISGGGNGYVTQEEFQAHVNSTTPHPNATSGGSSAATVDEEQITLINSRLMQAETNLANLYMQLNTENDLGVKPNLMLVEDFQGDSVCDNFVQNVTAVSTGSTSISLADDTGLIAGAYYTVSDGVSGEFVQITAIARANDTTTATLASPIENSYTIANTKLYRSTTTFKDGQAYGAGDVRSELFKFIGYWTGQAQKETFSFAVDLTHREHFELEGDWAFTADGYFTLA